MGLFLAWLINALGLAPFPSLAPSPSKHFSPVASTPICFNSSNEMPPGYMSCARWHFLYRQILVLSRLNLFAYAKSVRRSARRASPASDRSRAIRKVPTFNFSHELNFLTRSLSRSQLQTGLFYRVVAVVPPRAFFQRIFQRCGTDNISKYNNFLKHIINQIEQTPRERAPERSLSCCSFCFWARRIRVQGNGRGAR